MPTPNGPATQPGKVLADHTAGDKQPPGNERADPFFRTVLRALLIFVVVAVPLMALALAARWLLSYYRLWHRPPGPWVPVALIGFGVTGIYGLVLLLWTWRLRRATRALDQRRARLAERAAFFEDRTRRLTAQVELLSAMREVSRIVSDEVRFERILDESLRVVQDLVSAESITIFLLDQEAHGLRAAAHRGPDRTTTFDATVLAAAVDYENVEECLEYHTILRTFEHGRLTLSVPLDADQEPVGVLKIAVPLAGPADERENAAEVYDTVLPEIARHVALAVKTTALHSRSVTDGLTGLYNKRHFQTQLAALFDFSRRYEKPLALVLADIDHFKTINDTYGHLAGDLVLAGVARLVKRSVRKYDVPCRYGGEELAILMPETDLRQARRLAERIRLAARERVFGGPSTGPSTRLSTGSGPDGSGPRDQDIRLTISFGVAAFTKTMERPEDLVAAADEALYRAKQAGRDRVCTCLRASTHRQTGRFKRPSDGKK